MNKILLTGGSGFLGKIILQNLASFDMVTLGRAMDADIICDLSKEIPELSEIKMVIHAAGKAHVVSKTAADKRDFYDVNVKGTRNLLKGLDLLPSLPAFFVFISSVAVYGVETGRLVREDAPLLATDPYGQSKIEVENLVQQWCKNNNVICTILRLPLLAGPNPPGNLKAMINGVEKGYYFNIAGGTAEKSIVLAGDVAQIIPKAASIGGIYNLTDRTHPGFSDLAEVIASQLNKAKPLNMPFWLANLVAKAGDIIGAKAPLNSNKLKKITLDLTFDDNKAFDILHWRPTSVLTSFKIK